MPFYIMRQDTSIEGSRALDGLPDHMNPLDWVQGKVMSDPSPGQILTLNLSLESGTYKGDVIDGFLTLHHKSLRDTLISQGVDNINYFPVRLLDQNTNTIDEDYLIANIIGLIDCVDMAKSKTKPWKSGSGFDFQSMVIDEKKTHGLKLFRLKDDPTKVIINEDLKRYFDETDSLYGVELLRTEDYSDW